MAKTKTVRKFKKNDFSSDFDYGQNDRGIDSKKASKKKHRAANPGKNFDHLLYED